MSRLFLRPAAALTIAASAALAPLPASAQRPRGAAAPQEARQLRGLDEYVRTALRDWGGAGLAIAVVKGDSIVYARGFGVREVGKPDPVDERTLFAIGSITKSFTAGAVGILEDEGRLRLDDPATRYLPGLQLSDPYVTRELTVRDLLTHRSGLTQADQAWYGLPVDRAEVLRRVRHQPPTTSFRSRFGYNNIMFLAAGEIVATVSGKSWDDFVTERILRPLGMTSSNTSVRTLARAANVATPHAVVDGRAVPVAWRNLDNVGPAGAINSNVVELAQWARLLLGSGSLRGKRILSARFVTDMMTPQTIAGPARDTLFPTTHFETYGLGLFLQDYRGRQLVHHPGGIDGMISQLVLVPEEGLGVVVLTNTDAQELAAALPYRVIDEFLGVRPRDWSALFLARHRVEQQRADSARRALEAQRARNTRPSLPLEQYAGTYEHAMYGDVGFTLENGALVLHRGAEFTGRLEHWHHDVFRVDWAAPQIGQAVTFATFVSDGAGRLAHVELRGLPPAVNEEVMVFRRKLEAPAAAGAH